MPRAFFVFLPLFALFLELLYRAGRVGSYLPAPVRAVIGLTLAGWLFAYLPIALRQVYGGSRLMTGVKLVTLGVLYVLALFSFIPVIIGAALLEF